MVACSTDTRDEMADDEPPETGEYGNECQGKARNNPVNEEIALERLSVVEIVPEDRQREKDCGCGGDDESLPVVGMKLLPREDGEDENGGECEALHEGNGKNMHRHEAVARARRGWNSRIWI